MKISICTTCAQRLYQLIQVWDSNIQTISRHSHAEWILLNYDGDKDMHEFLMSRIEACPSNFVYARELTNRPWHLSVAKNIVHQLGSGTILFSLDCDNKIEDAVDMIDNHFNDDVSIMHLGSGVHRDGTNGRVAIRKQLFIELGGYDESFYPMASQDTDLMRRAKAYGCDTKVVRCSTGIAVKNTKEDSMKLCGGYNMEWFDFSDANSKKSWSNFHSKRLEVNQPHGMTKPNVHIFRGGLYH